VSVSVSVCFRVCVRACACACVRACTRACVHAVGVGARVPLCVCEWMSTHVCMCASACVLCVHVCV